MRARRSESEIWLLHVHSPVVPVSDEEVEVHPVAQALQGARW